MQRVGGVVSIDGVFAGEDGIEPVSDADSKRVVDFPEGADHVGIADELECGGQVDGLVDQVGSGVERGAAGDR